MQVPHAPEYPLYLAVIIIGAASRFVHIWNVGLFLAIMVLEPILETTQKILRGLKNQKLFAASGIIYTGILVSLNFLTVCVWKLGVTSLLVNTIISHVLIFCLEKRMRCLSAVVDKSELLITQKEMLKYSMPLVPSTLSWWVMSVSDRYVIRFFLGASYNGIYAICDFHMKKSKTINAMDGNNNSFPKHLRQPCKERRSFGVDVHHIVFSKCTIKCRKCGGADCSKSP